MCLSCWEKYGSPRIVNERTIEAFEAVKKVYEQSGVGGNLHIVLDDFNIEDNLIRFCMENYNLTPEETNCAQLFLGLSLEERASVLAIEWNS